jgi:hypothetical protein
MADVMQRNKVKIEEFKYNEMARLGKELNDFCIGLKWAAKCTQIKEKKNDQK